MNNDKIKIVSNVLYDDLYKLSRETYEPMAFEKINVSGKSINNMPKLYNFKFLKHIIVNKDLYDFDIMVYIDQDCFIVNQDALLDLINFTIDNDFDCVGMPDGGVCKIRWHNPVAINQFFSIINIKKIRDIYNENDIMTTVFTEDLIKYTPDHLFKSNSGFKYDDFEQNYKLFFWMLKNGFKFYYLDIGDYDGDNITTILKNHKGIDFAYHTWYAREWEDPKHQKRIKGVIDFVQSNLKNI